MSLADDRVPGGSVGKRVNLGGTTTSDGSNAGLVVIGDDLSTSINGIEVAEVADITDTQATLVFSGLKYARMWLRDDGSSAVGEMYYVLNSDTTAEAAARLAVPGSRLILKMGETIDHLIFDAYDPVVRIDYIADATESGANTLYIEGRI